MGNFKKYALRADELARKSFREYQEADKRLQEATAQRKKYPYKTFVGADAAKYLAQKARAEADYAEAQEAMEKVKRNLEQGKRDMMAIQQELEAEVFDTYSADPSQVDTKTLEILKSGILSVPEYNRLFNNAVEAGNYTMARMVSAAAGKVAETKTEEYQYQEKMELMAIERKSNEITGRNILDCFKVMQTTYDRSVDNPLMMGDWDSLTSRSRDHLEQYQD